MSVPATAMRRLMRELAELRTSPPEGIRVQTSDDDMLDVVGIIEGPEGTPYAGGYFKVKFKFTEEFPAAPPKCWFITKIFHPNVSSAGEICVNTLKKDWKSTYGIAHILVTVKCLLIYPNPESALDEEAGKLLLENYESYCSRAKLITSVHATPKRRPVEFDSSPEDETNPTTPIISSSSTNSTPDEPTSPKEAIASSSKLSPSITASSTSPLMPTALPSNTTTPTPLALPIINHKPTSQPPLLKSTLSSELKDGSKDKERHPSPSPLGTADANVGNGKAIGMGLGMGTPSTSATTNPKSMKRAATGGMTSGAEKRKKALKRL